MPLLLLTGIGLSMDAFAVSVTNGLCCRGMRPLHRVGMAVCFGLFQGMMPMIGFFLGKLFEDVICAYDHWIALILLCYIGGRMLWEAFFSKDEPETDRLTLRLTLMQGIATSIDALAVGVSFAALSDVPIVTAALLIAGITFAVSLTGVCFGRQLGRLLGSKAQIAGGLLLIGIGVKIFVEHMGWF
ncbi:MAG: manganese efflux pump MntP family protein [Oscillospiraceae bacterium]|nr:manganese efflux pump MntP family protein [Oscillospiraceae bacterium]